MSRLVRRRSAAVQQSPPLGNGSRQARDTGPCLGHAPSTKKKNPEGAFYKRPIAFSRPCFGMRTRHASRPDGSTSGYRMVGSVGAVASSRRRAPCLGSRGTGKGVRPFAAPAVSSAGPASLGRASPAAGCTHQNPPGGTGGRAGRSTARGPRSGGEEPSTQSMHRCCGPSRFAPSRRNAWCGRRRQEATP